MKGLSWRDCLLSGKQRLLDSRAAQPSNSRCGNHLESAMESKPTLCPLHPLNLLAIENEVQRLQS